MFSTPYALAVRIYGDFKTRSTTKALKQIYLCCYCNDTVKLTEYFDVSLRLPFFAAHTWHISVIYTFASFYFFLFLTAIAILHILLTHIRKKLLSCWPAFFLNLFFMLIHVPRLIYTSLWFNKIYHYYYYCFILFEIYHHFGL